MNTCPYCGSETRAGDNFCLSCGNRLVPVNSSPQQAQSGVGDSTVAADKNWNNPNPVPSMATVAASASSGSNWSDLTTANTQGDQPTVQADQPTLRGDAPATATQATIDKVENPAKFILRSDNGDVLQEYPLEKPEIAIGRAPNSDILLSKDKLTSRRHATVRYEDENYILRDERSANGTFVNGQQLEEMVPRILQDGDHVGIGEHELIFRSFGSSAPQNVEDLPTISVPYDAPGHDLTYRTRDDEHATAEGSDDFSTKTMDNAASAVGQLSDPSVAPQPEGVPATPPPISMPNAAMDVPVNPPSAPAEQPVEQSAPMPSPALSSEGVTFGRLTSLALPSLPDIAPLMAALSTLDGQVMSLQEQLNTTQDALRKHEADIAQTTNQLRTGVRRVSDRMDNAIADVARKREELAWSDLMQLIEDVQNNPRDVEYLQKLARKARELNKVFQIHQNVLNTLAECNSLLRSVVGEDRQG